MQVFVRERGLTLEQIVETEQCCMNMINSKASVYSKDTPLDLAKSIKGLRAVFGEVYPDPVRVVAVGVTVEELTEDPLGSAGVNTSVEFCGGTHVRNVGHIDHFVIVSEESIAKGIRRIVAVTGHEADRAKKLGDLFEKDVKQLAEDVSMACMHPLSNQEANKECQKLSTKMLNLQDQINQASIGKCCLEKLRSSLKASKSLIEGRSKQAKQEQSANLSLEVKELISQYAVTNGGDAKAVPSLSAPGFVVYQFQSGGSNSKAMNVAIKDLDKAMPTTAFFVCSVDQEVKKILCMAQVPKDKIEAGLKANEWISSVTETINGKGGGKPASAQATGVNYESVETVLKVANEFANSKLQKA